MTQCVWIIEEALYRVTHGVPEVVLFSRNYNNREQTVAHVIPGFTPYFYVPYNETHIPLPYNCSYDDELIIDALGREVRKVYVDIPATVAKIRDSGWSFTDMADFLFEKRFLVDKKIKYAYTYNETTNEVTPVDVPEILPPRIVYFDIEVLAPEGIIPLPMESKYPVVSIQVMDSYTKKILVFTHLVPQTDDPCHIACDSERELFKVFLEYIKQINPDLFTGWNSQSYDVPYLIRRSWKVDVDIKGLARIGKCRCEYQPEEGTFNVKVGGRSTVDMLLAFKKFTSGMAQRESYALKSVISDTDILGDKAFSYPDLGPIIHRIFAEKRYTEFIDYCKNDVIALETIDNTVNLFTFYENIKFISGCKLDDVLYNSKIIEMLILHEGIDPMPTKKHGTPTDSFEGATVITPKPGISEFMGTYDLASLYPNILLAFQKSPDKRGVFLKTLEKTMIMREDLRAKCKLDPDNILLENQQMAVKFLNNSYYGFLGLQNGRLYIKELAAFVTSTGRELNQFLQDVAKSQGYEVIFGDTDSIGVIPVNSVQIGKELETHLNSELARWSDERGCTLHFKLKFEKLYRRILFKADKKGEGVKKKYCGHIIWEEGRDKSNDRELNYKGLELKRSDQSEITRDVLHYFLEKVLIDGDTQDAVNYVKRNYKLVKSGNIPIMRVSIPKAIRKVANRAVENPWVRGIKYAEVNYNYILSEGSKPRLLYLTCGREICIDEDFDVTQIINEIDFEMMADKTIKQKMESYMWSIGYDWDKTINGQVGFDQWF